MWTIQEIKTIYGLWSDPDKSFEDYLRDNFTPVYDKELNFMGYEKNAE